MKHTRMLAAVAAGAYLMTAGTLLAAPTKLETATVTAVRVVPGAGRADVVLSYDGSVEIADFTLEGPHRIVVDLKGAKMDLRAPRYDRVSRAGIRNVRLAQYELETVRLVLDLDGPRQYEVIRSEGQIRVSVVGSDDFAPWSTSAAAVAAAPVSAEAMAVPVADVPVAPVSLPVSAPETPRRGAVRTANDAAPFVPVRPFQPQAMTQQRISITFNNADINDVISTFAAFSGRTFIVGRTVAGTVRFTEIVNQPWDVALRGILGAQGLSAVEDSTGIITVDSYDNLARRVASEPLVTQIVPINYADATVLAATIRSILAICSVAAGTEGAAPGGEGATPAPSEQLCGRGNVAVDATTNTLLVTETVSRLPEIVSYIRDLDVRTPQVAIKAKIISVDRTGTENMGIAYDFGGMNNNGYTTLNTDRPVSGTDYAVDFSGPAYAGIANASRTYRDGAALSLLFNTVINGNSLSAFLDALSSVQLSDIQAEPTTTTLDNRTARLFAGQQLSFLLTPPTIPGQIQAVAPTLTQQNIGITLEVTPHVTANRQVAMKISAIQETLDAVTQAGPQTSKRSSENEVLVADGETAVIGGLTQTQVTKVRSGIPILMNLPVIGRLFSQTSTIERKQDLLILVTPHIVDEGEVVRTTIPR